MRHYEQPYFELLSDVTNAIAHQAEKAGALLVGDWFERFSVGYCVAYEQNRSESFEIATLKGKPTRKYLHASIYRLHTGRYELTTYIL